ncbi:sulfotransferase domain-containing protein [Candidatus Pelagibacter communis]|uniref:Potential Sulfotransferase domain n=1 Tax=Pelagibacter ubique (strain HTCC1062) TaxID=335992 RepID=Q4FNV5_PELUB|nr:sulfotransferase domain-containing protein [Candidatus Pelagibacter ubique]AAZ21134.1 potential Sulfotransferase domain [Candidatus Pelagibacter ubique HTCC1062]
MIIWIASYPKSGNTYLRSFLASYYYSEDGNFNFDQLLKIHQFPNIKFSKFDPKTNEEASKNWMFNQNTFFSKNKLNLVKTHNCLYPYEGNNFTSKNQTLGAIYVVRDPRNLITSLTHHYVIGYKEAIEKMSDENSSLLEKSHDNDYSNFTYLSSWSNHYKSWKNNSEFKTLFIKYEDLRKNKIEIFKKIIFFINEVTGDNKKIDEQKFYNSIKTTSFSNLKNKELNEGFEESVYSKKTGKKINFFNLGFNNRWQKILPLEIKNQINEIFKKDLHELDYPYV